MTRLRREGHHSTATYNDVYLDGDFVVRLGVPCHIATHQVRATVDLDRAVDRAGPLDELALVELRLRRTAADLTFFALPPEDACVPGCLRHDMEPDAVRALFADLGVVLSSWADALANARRAER